MEDMRAYIAAVKQLTTNFEPQAETMLKNYLAATKVIRKSKI